MSVVSQLSAKLSLLPRLPIAHLQHVTLNNHVIYCQSLATALTTVPVSSLPSTSTLQSQLYKQSFLNVFFSDCLFFNCVRVSISEKSAALFDTRGREFVVGDFVSVWVEQTKGSADDRIGYDKEQNRLSSLENNALAPPH